MTAIRFTVQGELPPGSQSWWHEVDNSIKMGQWSLVQELSFSAVA